MDHMSMGNGTSASTGASTRPEHGTWEGHILPGSFFLIWSTWWLYSNFSLCIDPGINYNFFLEDCIVRLYLRSGIKRPYKSRSWYDFPSPGSKYPVEPILKMLLPFIGINAELWAGHVSYRRMYNPETGSFEQGNIQDWQHSAMYAAFIISGAVDLIGFYTNSALLPQGTEHGFLGISLLIEGLLFGFHLKGSALDMRLHLILVLVIFLSSLVCFLEIQHPHSFALSTVRAQLVMLQGVWFYQIAAILFKDNPAWDPTAHASVMMVPFFFVMWIMIISFGTVLLFTGASIFLRKPSANYQQVGHGDEIWSPSNGHSQTMVSGLELNGVHHR